MAKWCDKPKRSWLLSWIALSPQKGILFWAVSAPMPSPPAPGIISYDFHSQLMTVTVTRVFVVGVYGLGIPKSNQIDHLVNWEPEGHSCRPKMFRWEPEGRYCNRLCTAIAPFWFSTEHLWSAITPFWLSTDDLFLQLCPLWLGNFNVQVVSIYLLFSFLFLHQMAKLCFSNGRYLMKGSTWPRIRMSNVIMLF